ncbi:MAG: hypothetical protein J5989_06970 [Alistipes sp.]|nr:hypothetical protein [Alistipes sp.]
MKFIDLPNAKKAQLVRLFGKSRQTIWAALNYVTDSDLAKKIRKAALNMGGVVKNNFQTPEGFMPNCETKYIHGEGTVLGIIQTFPNNVRVEFENKKEIATISCDGEVVKVFEKVILRDWTRIVYEAQSLSDTLNEE